MLTERIAAKRIQFLWVAVAAAAMMANSGCRAAYIARVGYQHLRYVGRARPISEEIAATADADTRRLLELVLEVRGYAEEQGLEVGGSYLEVADTSGLATAHVVTAAYADRLEPYTWHYPIVGEIPYRGYFERDSAESYAAKLARRGLDTYIVEAAGYSTLGWFDDPLPSRALALGDVGLADMVFHELVHQTLYVPGHIAFNETLASAVAARMTIAFFESRGSSELAEQARARRSRWLEQGAYCDELAGRLRAYFAEHSGDGLEGMLGGRGEIYAEARARLGELGVFASAEEAGGGDDVAAGPPINNALFLAIYRYRRDARRIDAYLDHFAAAGDAIAALATATKQAPDPYSALDRDKYVF